MGTQLPAGSSYGEIRHQRKVSEFVFSEVAFPAGLNVPRHSHEALALYIVLEGAYNEVYPGRTVMPKPFRLALMPAGEVHWHCCGQASGRCFVVNVDPQRLVALGAGALTAKGAEEFSGPLLTSLALRLYREFQNTDEMAPLAMEGLVLEILAEASRHSRYVSDRYPPRWLEQARELLHAQFSKALVFASIAEAVNVHPVHLARAFRQHYRCTIGEYVRRLRIEYACRELFRSDTPLALIALDAGFADQSHLTRTFKRLTGMTPAQFRAISRQR
jgi:AraC family transcriptional regulator